MEKQRERKQKEYEKIIWDCESSLYDSFELNQIERRLYSSIHSKTLSMPHLSDSRLMMPPAPANQPPDRFKKSTPSKISRSFHKLFRSVFKPKQQQQQQQQGSGEEKCKDDNGSYAGRICDKLTFAVLPTILEDPVFGGYSLRSPARYTASNRFTAVFPST